MKKFGSYCLLLCFLLTHIGICTAVSANELSSEAANLNSCYGVDASSALLGAEPKIENVQSAVMYEANSGTLMYALNADAQMYPASLVKILTALIAAEKGSLTDVVSVTDSAISTIPSGAVSADLMIGEQIGLEDLMYCMLVGSANDAAAVIAEHISGSQSAFVQEMNQYAQSLGCTGTQFANAHGLHNEAQYTTARDAARILAAAMDNEIFRAIFTTVNHTVDATNKSEARELVSNNSLMDATSRLYFDKRVVGGRTGVTEDGGRCLAACAESNGMRLITVVMGAQSVYQEDGYTAVTVGGYKETSMLLDAGFGGYKTVQLLFPNQALRQCAVTGGDCDVIVGPQISVSTVLPEDISATDLSFRYSEAVIQAPITAGQKLSDVRIWYGNMCVAQADLFAMNSVSVADHAQEDVVPEKHSDDFPPIIAVVLWILVGSVLILLLSRWSRRLRVIIGKSRSKRYRRSRRRTR